MVAGGSGGLATPNSGDVAKNDPTNITVNKSGYFVYKGQKYTLFQLIQLVLLEHANIIAKSNANELESMNEMNQHYKIASATLAKIRALRPEDTDTKISRAKLDEIAAEVQAEYPEASSDMFWQNLGVESIYNEKEKFNQADVDQLIEGLRSKLSSVGQDQEAQKVRLQRGLHAQDETYSLLSATERTITQTVEGIIQRVS